MNETMENKITPELMEKARRASSPEELLALAKENEIELSEEEAKMYFEQLNRSGELSDEELDNVSGGGCYNNDGRLVVTSGYSCKRFECKKCGKGKDGNEGKHQCTGSLLYGDKIFSDCSNCKYYEKHVMRRLCNHPLNYKR